VALALAAGGALALYLFSYTPELPAQLGGTRADVQQLQQQNALLQTQVAELVVRDSASRELLQELEQELGSLGNLGEQMRENAVLASTIQAEARDSRTAVALYATAQAGREAQIDELQQRTDRVIRFLARLSDISGDAAIDLGEQGTETQPPTVALPLPSETPVIPAPTATASSEATATQETSTPAVTRTSTSQPAGSATPTPQN
jgi:hypothetical protein